MSFSIGIDIGGTKVAGALFEDRSKTRAQESAATPASYAELLALCGALVERFDQACGQKAPVGIGVAGLIDREKGTVFAPNIPCLKDQPFRADCEKKFGRKIDLANDADCAALAEAIEGTGQGYRSVFGLIMGTGVGGGIVIDGKIYQGAHGLAGEIGHLPLPCREDSDGPVMECGCGQRGCIDKFISGPALARLYKHMTGHPMEDPRHIVTSLAKADPDAKRVLDRFCIVVAKAMVTVIHTLDPDIIVVSGGLSGLPGLYEEVPKHWGRYSVCKNLRTKFMAAKFGTLSGVRGAALLVE